MTNPNSTINSEELSDDQIKAREKLLRLAEAQGVKPMSWEQLKAMGDLWPEDESIDDFIATLREWRNEERENCLDNNYRCRYGCDLFHLQAGYSRRFI